jgi:hypothetical protein
MDAGFCTGVGIRMSTQVLSEHTDDDEHQFIALPC